MSINEAYKNDIEIVKECLANLAPTASFNVNPDNAFDFDVNMSTMTERLWLERNDASDMTIIEVPFLTSFNLIVSYFADADYLNGIISKAGSVFPHLSYFSGDEFKNRQIKLCSYVNNVINDICSLSAYSVRQHLIYFSLGITSSEFKDIPFVSFSNKNQAAIKGEAIFQYAHNANMDGLVFSESACENWLKILNISLFAIACTEKALRKCKLCGRYFVPENRSDEMYCRFPNESRGYKPCKELYKRIAQAEREQNNESFRINKNIYNRLLNRSVAEADDYIKRRNKVKPKKKGDAAADAAYLEWLKEEDKKTRRRK